MAGKSKSAHADLVTYWCTRWKEIHNAPYPFTKRDAAHVKQVLAAVGGDLARAQGVVDAYLGCRDKWHIEHRHKLGNLIADLPRFIAKGAGAAGAVRPGELPYALADKPLPRAPVCKPAAGPSA